MPDVLQQFLQASGAGPDAEADGDRTTPHAPWDLLIVDECHHFAPQSGSRASQRTRMLREIRFLFEHRIFASATPHNGKTVCFTGLLELLDPIRFQMTVEMDDEGQGEPGRGPHPPPQGRHQQAVAPPPFAEQLPPGRAADQALAPGDRPSTPPCGNTASRARRPSGSASAAERWLGQFIYSLLTKRLLSCPFAFARTWWRHLEDEAEPDDQASLFDMARVSAERAEEQAKSDDERSVLEEDAARYSGAWFRSQGRTAEDLQRRVNQALEALGYDRQDRRRPRQAGGARPEVGLQDRRPGRAGSRRTCSPAASSGTTSGSSSSPSTRRRCSTWSSGSSRKASTRTRCGCSTAA